MMADTEGEAAKCEAVGIADKAEHHAEPAVRRWQIDLETGGKLRAVATFRIAAAQGLDLNTFLLELSPSFAKRLGTRAATPHRVLGEGALVEEDAGIPPPDGQGLPLAVCGLKWPVLGL